MTFSVASALFLLGGCSPSGKNRLVGTWEADADELMKAAAEEMKDLPPEARKQAEAQLKATKMRLEFHADGTASMQLGPGNPQSATWEVLALRF
jgi:hypothetical protein